MCRRRWREASPQSQYSAVGARFLIGMGVRVPRLGSDVSAAPVVKPLVVLAARFLGPGPLRLKMVKLAHELDDRQARRIAA